MVLTRFWNPTERREATIAKKYGFEKYYLPDIVLKGYRLQPKLVKGKKFLFAQLFKDGKLIEEFPVLEREIDIYVTGRYKIRSGKQKGQEVQVTIRLPLKVTYIPKKEFLDDIRNDIENEAIKKFEEWGEIEIPTLQKSWDKVEVELKEKMEEK